MSKHFYIFMFLSCKQVYVFKTIEQLIFTFGVSTTIIEDKLDNIERYLLCMNDTFCYM